MRSVGYALSTLLASELAHASPSWTPPSWGHDHHPPGWGNHGPGNHDPLAEHNKLGAVTTQSKLCSNVGIDVLKAGGNAADSMVALTFCIGVISMYHSGIGGGGFMTVRGKDGCYEFIDFRESAPAAATQDMYNNNINASLYGGLASGVPGELRGLAHLHTKYGSIAWADLIQPSIKLARDGFAVNQDLVHYMALGIKGIDNFLVNDPAWAIDFAPNGTLVGLGDTLTRKRYAATLESIAERGPDALYTGPIAQAMINRINATGGIMTMEDLKNYDVKSREPSTINYRDYKLTSGSAPSSGTVALSAMKIIEGYKNIGEAATLNESTHLFDEAIRFAYGQRSQLGDPLFVKGLDEYEADMLKEETAAAVRAKINPYHTLNVSAYDPSGFESLNTHGTSAMTTADASGLAISLTTTVNTYFGSTVIVPETGVIMNNEMNDFSVPGVSNTFGYIPSPANYIRPNKRPLSSICPVIVERKDGPLYFVVASAGGSRIITAVLQNIWHVLDQNMTAPEAMAAPRLHDQLVPNQVSFEYAYNNETVAFMKSLGHNITFIAPGQSTAASLRRLDNGTFEGAGEPRQLDSGGFVI